MAEVAEAAEVAEVASVAVEGVEPAAAPLAAAAAAPVIADPRFDAFLAAVTDPELPEDIAAQIAAGMRRQHDKPPVADTEAVLRTNCNADRVRQLIYWPSEEAGALTSSSSSSSSSSSFLSSSSPSSSSSSSSPPSSSALHWYTFAPT